MGFKDKFLGIFKRAETVQTEEVVSKNNYGPARLANMAVADFNMMGQYNHLFSIGFDGEKTLGEMGPAKNYRPDYVLLRVRSWQSYYESEISQAVLNKYINWVIGSGLKLQAQPNELLLESEGVKVDAQKFSKLVEARFFGFKEDTNCSYNKMWNLDKLQQKAYKDAIIGGDVLVILRFDKKQGLNVQLIDGEHVFSPTYGNEIFPQTLENGNKLLNGVEMDDTGRHVAYWVRKAGILPNSPYDMQYERIPAVGTKSGLTQAFLVYGLEMRLDNMRGVPILIAVLEILKVLERYKAATVGSAEERQKIAYFIAHKIGSTGENPLANEITTAISVDGYDNKIPVDQLGQQLADKIASTTGKQTYNMPIESELKSLESRNELHFKEFYEVNFDLICAAIGIPPDVASGNYESNYSASRAAIKDWEHTLNIKRKDFANAFLKPIYKFWLEVEIFLLKIDAPGYIKAKLEGNNMLLGAYSNARFVGPVVPHIDPMKEVQAERLKLGSSGDAIPLTTAEAATERLDGGEFYANVDQYGMELEQTKALGIESPMQEKTEDVNEENEEENSVPAKKPVKKISTKKGASTNQLKFF